MSKEDIKKFIKSQNIEVKIDPKTGKAEEKNGSNYKLYSDEEIAKFIKKQEKKNKKLRKKLDKIKKKEAKKKAKKLKISKLN